ncbi:uncharacterized protein LOC132730360 [Ruditapes philippinarum]|uniref:uncharacterized protein LOC132730360 n=1 Tax=Ruditapes philippinarum TaxID=129788 RepID=UPI00295B595C|nr:uncharacterized protein LOC132730360 [Ruditapes philippinarum]
MQNTCVPHTIENQANSEYELGDKIEQQERETANFERKEEDLKEIIEELGDKIEQQEREKANFERKEEDLKEIIEELGDKIEQQEREKANFERKEEDLKEIIEELGDKIEQQEREKANFERKEEDLKEIIEELGDKIEQQEREKANFERKEEDLKEIIEELGDKIEQQEREKANFERKEEDLKEIIEKLKNELMTKTEKAKLTAEMKESIANQVHVYQEEVQQQKQIIYSVNVKEFLSFPSPTKLHSIGGDLSASVRQELGDDIKDIDKTVATLIRISTVVTKEDKKSCETVCQCADNILEEAFKADSNVGSLFANAYLVYIGLLKGEDKKYRPPSDITGPLIVLEHIVKQTYFPHQAKNIISAFMNKPHPLLDKSFASEWRESGKKKKKQKPKPTPAPTENHNDTKPDRRDNRDRNERDNRDRNKEQKENGERNFCEQSDNYRQRARRNDNRLPRLSGGRGRPDRAGDRPERGEEENEKDVYRDRGFDCGRGRGRGFGPRRGRGGGSGRGVGGTFRPNRGFENKNSQIDNGPQIDTWTNETAVIGEKEPKISNWGDSKEDWNEDIDSWTESLAETKVITASGSSASEPTNQVPIESNALSNTFDLGGLYPKHLQNDMSAEARYISQFNQQATESIKNCIGIGSGQSSSLQNSMTSQTASNGNSLTGTSVTGSGLSFMTGSSLSAGSQSVAGPSNAIPASSVSQNAMLQQRQKPQRSKLPPPSKIPASAVEMPGYMMTTLDVQFGNLEFGSDSSAFSFRGNESVNSAFTSADSNSTSTVNDHGGATVGQVQNLSKTSESLISGGLEQSSPRSSSLCQQSPYTTRTKQNQRLSKQVEVLVEERAATESKTEHLLVEINDMQTEAKQKVENLHQPQLEELQKGDQSPSEAEMELPAGWVWQDDWQKDLGRAVDEEGRSHINLTVAEGFSGSLRKREVWSSNPSKGTPSPYWDEAFDFVYRTPVTPYTDNVFSDVSPGAAGRFFILFLKFK